MKIPKVNQLTHCADSVLQTRSWRDERFSYRVFTERTHFPSGNNNQCIAISAVLVNGKGIHLMKFSNMEHGLIWHQGLPRKNGG